MSQTRTINVKPGDVTVIRINVKPALREWLIECIKESGMRETNPVYYCALGHLVGVSPQAAVKAANAMAARESKEKITTRGFCKWLANVLSRFFAESFEEN